MALWSSILHTNKRFTLDKPLCIDINKVASKEWGCRYKYSVCCSAMPRASINEKRLHCRGTSGPSWPIRQLGHIAYPVSPSSLSSAEGFLSDSSLPCIGLFSLPMGLICASCFWIVAKKMQEQSQLRGLGRVGPAVPLCLQFWCQLI